MFFCQQDSFAKELETVVVSTKPSTRKLELVPGGRKETVPGVEVVCEDTVLFPEGGGQNTDKGVLAGLPVLEVTRQGEKAVHFVDTRESSAVKVTLDPGTSVLQTVDWSRRFDNMQQHSGQHLVSAVLEREHNTNTLSWWMAENSDLKVGVSYIELDQALDTSTLEKVEQRCNELIMSALPVTVTVLPLGDPGLEEGHTRGLPDDFKGPVRLVNIPGVDSNLCCGTHVTNLAQLQVIKLVGEMETKKGKHWLYFLVGGRVTRQLQACQERERGLIKLLNNGPEDHLDLVGKMQRGLKGAQRNVSSLLKEVAIREAERVTTSNNAFCVVHRKEGDSEFISTFLKELDNASMLVVVIVGEEKGQLVVSGPISLVQGVGKRLCELLDGKGGGKGERFNAKVNNLKNLPQIEVVVKNCLETLQ